MFSDNKTFFKYTLHQNGNTFNRRKGITFFEVILLLLIIGGLAFYFVPTREKPHHDSEIEACNYNIKVIMGAIEMYNNDPVNAAKHITTQLDDPAKDPSTLFSKENRGKYLKSPINPPSKNCSYKIQGNVTKEGKVICVWHNRIKKELGFQ